jgi:hypothetical protein
LQVLRNLEPRLDRAMAWTAEFVPPEDRTIVFHDEVLGHGSLPLATLRREIGGWVAAAVSG